MAAKRYDEITPKKPPMLPSKFWGEKVDWEQILGEWPDSVIDPDAERFSVKMNSKLFLREAWQTVWLGADCPKEARCPFTGIEIMCAETRALWPIQRYMLNARYAWIRKWFTELQAQRADIDGRGPRYVPFWRRKDYTGNPKDYQG